MKSSPNELEQMMSSPEAAKLLKNKEAIMALSNSPDAQKIIQMLTKKSGGNLQAAAQAAMQGDTSQLSKLVSELGKHPETAKAVDNLSRNLPK